MMKKVRYYRGIILLYSIIALQIFGLLSHAVAQQLPSVDAETAQTQIEQFSLENEQLTDEIASIEGRITELEADLIKWESWVEAIGKVSEELVISAENLIDVLSQIANKEVLESAQNVLVRYGDTRELLDERSVELLASIEAGKLEIDEGLVNIEVYGDRISRNSQNIDLLTAAMDKSRTSEEALAGLIEEINEALDEAESLLSLE